MNEIIITTISKAEIQQLIESAVQKAIIQNASNNKTQTDTFLDVDQAAAFIGIAKATLYGKCSQKHIPYFKKGKKLYFDQQELIEWLKTGKRKTIDDIHAIANTYLGNQRV